MIPTQLLGKLRLAVSSKLLTLTFHPVWGVCMKFCFQWHRVCHENSRSPIDRLPRMKQLPCSRQAGFTLPEVLAVIAIVAILAGIAGPSWLGWQTKRLLRTAQDEAFQAMRQAQLQAIQSHQTWRISFRAKNNQIEWAIHPAGIIPTDSYWQPLHPQIRFAPETTLKQDSNAYFVEFNHKGNVTPPFGRLSFSSIQGDRHRSCVFVSTLLGAMRKATDQACY